MGDKICLNSVLRFGVFFVYIFFVVCFFRKLNTDKENKICSVQLQGNFDAALEYVHSVRKYISFPPKFNHIRFGSKHKFKKKAQILLEGKFQQQADQFT